MKIKEIIVVEGRDDTKRIKEAVEADTIETNGSAIDEAVLRRIEKAQEIRGVIVLTDPDYPGGKIRETVTQRIPHVKHAFIKKSDCQSPKGGSLGVEHAGVEVIRAALENVHTPASAEERENMQSFCRQVGLIGNAHSASYREVLGDALGIGHANGKQFVKRMEMFRIPKEEVVAVMEEKGLPVPEAVKRSMTNDTK